jgi:hypothetical protein
MLFPMNFSRFFFCVLLVLLTGFYQLQAQVNIGLKAGVGTYDVLPDSIGLAGGGLDNGVLKVNNVSPGYFAGLVAQINRKGFIIQPEVIYHYHTTDFDVSLPGQTGSLQRAREKYQTLATSLMLGTKAGPLRLNLGPVGYYLLKNDSQLVSNYTFESATNHFVFGFQAGLGVDVWKLLIDLRYESYFQRFGDHLIFAGNSVSFQDTAKRLVASVAFVF